MSEAAFVLLWCFVFVVPWEEVVPVPFLGSLPHLIGVAACIGGTLHVLARGSLRPLSWFHWFAIAFVLWAGVSSLWTIDPVATRARLMTYLQLVVLVWLIWEIAWSPERQRALLQAFVLGTCFAALGTVSNYLSGVSVDVEAARFSTLHTNPNELGLTLVLGLPMAWYLSLSHPQRRGTAIYRFYIPLGVTAILLTASRGAFAAALVALLVIPWTSGHMSARTKAAVYAVTVGSLLLAASLVPRASLDRLGSTRSDMAAGYFGGRGVIWKSGLEIVRENPLVGVGAGAFGAAVEPGLGRYLSSHQGFLSILVEEGTVGLALFLCMALAVIGQLSRLPTLQRRFSIVILAVLGISSLSAAWDYRKPLWFALGLLASQAALRRASRVASRRGVVSAAAAAQGIPVL